ncbi:MAG: phosphatase domain-containing protein [Bacteriovoracaceae bacterium]
MVKKLLLLIALIYMSVSNVFAGVSVITDINETVKRTRGENFRGFYHSFLSHKMFGGMDFLLKEMDEYVDDLYLVSGSYDFMRFNVDKLAAAYKLKPKEIYTRAPFRHNSNFSYKYETIKRIIENSKEQQFILMGDDAGVDQDVYAAIKKDFPGKILEIYIHVVKNEKKPSWTVEPFHTAFDVAVNEYNRGRLGKEKVFKIGKAVFNEEKFHKVFPGYAHCPKEAREISTKRQKDFDLLIGDITKRTLDFCNS